MCFSALASYAPRPVRDPESEPQPLGPDAWERQKINDPNLFRPQAQANGTAAHANRNGHEHHSGDGHHHAHQNGVTAVATQLPPNVVQSTIVTMPDGRRVMITPLD